MSNEVEEMSEHPLPSDSSDDKQMYSAEYKDGQLHIVEVSPYDKGMDSQNQSSYESSSILPELTEDCDGEQTKYLQLDLLNFTIVKNNDGTNTYQMVSSDSATAENGDTTITCVLSSDDLDEGNEESYVMLQTDDDQDPYMFLQSTDNSESSEPATTEHQKAESQQEHSKTMEKSKTLTPVEILEKAKALQKAKAFIKSTAITKSKRGRKKKSDLPPPMELLSSPNFKLYLYSCKLCTFKCNAVKEMSAHKKCEHAGGGAGGGGGGGGGGKYSGVRAGSLQCARCPYRGHTHTQLMNHVGRAHAPKETIESNNEYITALQLDSEEVEAADVLVCGACGFESGDRTLFKKHIEDEHGAITRIE